MNWTELLAKVSTLLMYYETAHWQSKSSFFYQDHLLFERLYDSVEGEVDPIAEKAIGVTGDRSLVNPKKRLEFMSSTMSGLPTECEENIEFVIAALDLERSFVSYLDRLGKSSEISEGVRNLLAGMQDVHEGHIYLLQQRAATRS